MMTHCPDGINRDIRKTIVINLPAHVNKDLEESLSRNGDTNELGVTVYNYGFGYIIPCYENPMDLMFHRPQIAPELYPLMEYAQKQGCDTLCLDEEGPVMPDLPNYEVKHKIIATNIEWDVDEEEDLDYLPKEVEIPEGITDPDEISDYLSDTFGFCHNGFSLSGDCENDDE